MWNEKTVQAGHHGSGSIPVHFPDCLPSENAHVQLGMSSSPIKRSMNNHWTETGQINSTYQSINWQVMKSDNTGILSEHHVKSDIDFADIPPTTVEVDESDFMHYTIEDIKLEWPPELKFSTPGTAGRDSPVPKFQPAVSPLPVLSTLAVSGILGSLPPVSPPPNPKSQQALLPSYGGYGRMDQFPRQHYGADIPTPAYPIYHSTMQKSLHHHQQSLPLKNFQNVSDSVHVSDRQVQLPPSDLSVGNDAQTSRELSDSETETASDTSWRESSDEDFAKKFEREDQMEELLQCYQKGGINTNDSFIYCDLCNRRWGRTCPEHGKLKHFKDTKVEMGKEGRARKTAPRCLSILPSKIKGANNGVWTKKQIPCGVYFGPYEGCEVLLHAVANREYCWKVTKDGKPQCLIDGSDPNQSNWMRYVNCARTVEEQNLEAFQFRGEIFYRTTKVIEEHQELLVWYGFKFGLALGINWRDFVESNLPHNKGTIAFSCGSCFHAYANPILLQKHMKQSRCKRTLSLLKECADKHTPPTLSVEDSSLCMEVTTGDLPITCGVCGARFRRRGKPLQYHMESHGDRNHHCCLKCGQWFPDECALREHKIAASQMFKSFPEGRDNNENRQKAVICTSKPYKKRFKTLNKVPELLECTKNYPSRRGATGNGTDGDLLVPQAGMNDNVPNHQGEENEGQLVSQTEIAENQTGDQVHGIIEQVPGRRYKQNMMLCDKCGVMFHRLCLLVRHLERHHGIQSKEKEMFAKICRPKRFNCKECGMAYRKKETLEKHLQLHEETSENEVSDDAGDEKKFSCTNCDMKFRAEITLKFHMEVHKDRITSPGIGPASSTKKFKCKECDVRFRARSTLKLHKKTHDEEKRLMNERSSTLRPRSSTNFFPITRKTDERALSKSQEILSGGICGMGIAHDEKQNSPPQELTNDSTKDGNSSDGVPRKRLRRAMNLECLACGFIFKDRAGLDMHVRKHIDEKMLLCDLSRAKIEAL